MLVQIKESVYYPEYGEFICYNGRNRIKVKWPNGDIGLYDLSNNTVTGFN